MACSSSMMDLFALLLPDRGDMWRVRDGVSKWGNGVDGWEGWREWGGVTEKNEEEVGWR